tara:strand:+ start:4131 stop:4520 length:390 start_codon:yes stop_codon:yes gene_type:complete
MSFKLGQRSRPVAIGGRITKPHDFDGFISIEHADLDDGVTAEAVSSSKVLIDKDVPKDSVLYKQAEAHELLHAKEMRDGDIDYGEDFVRDGNEVYEVKDGMVLYNGDWYQEGDEALPWEQRAIKEEKNV